MRVCANKNQIRGAVRGSDPDCQYNNVQHYAPEIILETPLSRTLTRGKLLDENNDNNNPNN